MKCPYRVACLDPAQCSHGNRCEFYKYEGSTDLSEPVKYEGDLTVSDHPESDTGAKREKLNTPPYDLVPFQEITNAFTRVAEHGAVKYEPWNWSKGLPRVQLLGSLLRHGFAYLRGQDRDPDSGLLHTDHILWNATALCHNVEHSLEDGRRKEPPRDYYKK